MVIPGDNVRQQLDKNSVHTNSPEETREPHRQFIQYPRELQSSSKISKGTTIYLICTGILIMVLSTQIRCIIPYLASTFAFLVIREQVSFPLWYEDSIVIPMS
jgi:hypothetical protein